MCNAFRRVIQLVDLYFWKCPSRIHPSHLNILAGQHVAESEVVNQSPSEAQKENVHSLTSAVYTIDMSRIIFVKSQPISVDDNISDS